MGCFCRDRTTSLYALAWTTASANPPARLLPHSNQFGQNRHFRLRASHHVSGHSSSALRFYPLIESSQPWLDLARRFNDRRVCRSSLGSTQARKCQRGTGCDSCRKFDAPLHCAPLPTGQAWDDSCHARWHPLRWLSLQLDDKKPRSCRGLWRR